MNKPSVFIGSSSEAVDIARAIEFQLQHDGEITVWTEGFFGLGNTTLETLVNSLERFDFAILVLTPDDFVVSRDMPAQSPRDNVMFELGLFMGHLGRSRTFIAYDVNSRPKIPSDLAGVSAATFDGARSDGNLIAAVGPACTVIRNAIRDLGPFDGKSVYRLQRATDQVEGISETVARLVHLLARSRVVELDVIANQFGAFISAEALAKMRDDLKALEESTEPRGLFLGPVCSDLATAKELAKQKDMPVFMVIFDNEKPTKSKLSYSLGYFLEYQTTKDLVRENFVQALVDSKSPDVAQYIPSDNPLENCLLVILTSDGEVIRREGVYANPDEGLERVREYINQWKAMRKQT